MVTLAKVPQSRIVLMTGGILLAVPKPQTGLRFSKTTLFHSS
jgi:hypothetical protein